MASRLDLEAACRAELAALWTDLDSARRRAIPPGAMSMECEWLQGRIEKLTALVGPTRWEEVPITLLEDGVYQRIYAGLGVEVDMGRVSAVRRSINESVRHGR